MSNAGARLPTKAIIATVDIRAAGRAASAARTRASGDRRTVRRRFADTLNPLSRSAYQRGSMSRVRIVLAYRTIGTAVASSCRSGNAQTYGKNDERLEHYDRATVVSSTEESRVRQ